MRLHSVSARLYNSSSRVYNRCKLRGLPCRRCIAAGPSCKPKILYRERQRETDMKNECRSLAMSDAFGCVLSALVFSVFFLFLFLIFFLTDSFHHDFTVNGARACVCFACILSDREKTVSI